MLKLKNIFNDSYKNFYYLIFCCLIAVLFTHPFLKYPYDIYHHLQTIDRFYESTTIPNGREIWHFLWAKFFYFFSIPNSEIFFRAKIIHIVQTYVAFFSIYYFSHVVIRNVFQDINKIILKYLAFWSVVIWLTIFATFSMYNHLIWNLWYSVNYQITLPLFWYITALTLVLVLEKNSLKKKLFFVFQILLISRFILQAHSMEFMYYLMYMVVLSLIYFKQFILFFKRYFYFLIPIILIIWFFIKKFQPEQSKIFNYLNFDNFPILYELIIRNGNTLLDGLNRAYASINELMHLIFYLSIITTILIIKNRSNFINKKILLFIFITSLFVLIPISQFWSGLFGVITSNEVVNRLYYSSSLFILLPTIVYILLIIYYKNKITILKTNLLIIFILFSTFIYSKYNAFYSHNYYKNIKSIQDSFLERKTGFNLNREQINFIGVKLKEYELKNDTNLPIYYYSRADIMFVIKYVYRKHVYYYDRRSNPDYIVKYNSDIKIINRKSHLILFDIPKNFPEYEPYK